MNEIIDSIGAAFGLDPAAVLGLIALISLIARLIGKAIPDDAVGFQAVIRKVSKVLGLYVSNRIQPKVSVNDVSQAAMHIPNVARNAKSHQEQTQAKK